MWLHNAADAAIWLAYVGIPLVLVHFIRKRRDVPFPKVFWMFGLFIVSCGLTHLMSVVTTVVPVYRADAMVKLLTAAASWGTVFFLIPLMPKALALRSPRELERINARLVENERLKDEFVANVSHELRTPLTLILSPLETALAADGPPAPSLDPDALRSMHRNAVRLLQMVNGLLDFSRLDSGKHESRPEAADPVALARIVQADFRPLAERRGLTLRCETVPPLPRVRLDRHVFERAAFNLLSNALKFTDRGEVVLRLSWAAGRLTLSVRDTGCGIAADDLPRLFQRFRQLEGSSTRRFEGTGLGLALVKELVESVGGRVAVDSAPGRGSTFTVEMPAPEAGPDEAAAPESARLVPPAAEAAPQVGGNGAPDSDAALPKVLIVEDNPDLAVHMRGLLDGLCRVRLEADGEQGLQAARDWAPDLVLSDVMMPGRDGFSLCREIKSDPATSATSVLLLTALTHRDALLKGWEAGADEYLFKPFHPRELQTRVRSLLDGALRRRREREYQRLLEDRTSRLEEAVGNLEAFSYTVAHDLKAPLRGMRTYSQLLLAEHGTGLSADARDCVGRIVKSAEQMDALIRDLLAYSRLTQEKFTLGIVDPSELIRSILEQMAPVLEEKGAEVEVESSMPPVRAHPTTLGLALGNLLSNAVKFVAPGVKPRLSLGAERADGRVRLWVRDNGIGVPEKYRHKLFRLFERLHDDKVYPGTGIGLAIVKKAAERMDGTAGFESEPGKGSRFWIDLPPAEALSK